MKLLRRDILEAKYTLENEVWNDVEHKTWYKLWKHIWNQFGNNIRISLSLSSE